MPKQTPKTGPPEDSVSSSDPAGPARAVAPSAGRGSLLSRLVKVLLAGFATLVLFEVVGQTLVFRDKLYFVNDVDHRMEPFSAEDVNSDGIRSRVEATSFPAEDRNIVFLGDSFVYGFRLELEE